MVPYVNGNLKTGLYILQNTMVRGGENGAAEKNEKWGSEEQNEKDGKRGNEKGERKKKERKRGGVMFLLIYGTLLMIIVY